MYGHSMHAQSPQMSATNQQIASLQQTDNSITQTVQNMQMNIAQQLYTNQPPPQVIISLIKLPINEVWSPTQASPQQHLK